MKILVLSNMYPPDVLGGYELGCKQAVDWLRAQGHEVRVLTSTPRTVISGPDDPDILRRFQLNDLWYNATRFHSHPAVNKVWDVDANWFSAHNVHVLLQELEGFRPDVVYVWMLTGVGGLGLVGAQPVPARIEQGFRRRLDALPADTRSLMLVAAAEPAGDTALVWQAAGRLGIPGSAAEPAQADGLLETGARVRFRPPLPRLPFPRQVPPDRLAVPLQVPGDRRHRPSPAAQGTRFHCFPLCEH